MESCEFVLGPSRFLSRIFYLVYLGAGILLLLADPLSLTLRLGGIATIFYCLNQVRSLHVKRSHAKSVLAVWQDAKGRWGCQMRNGQCYRGILLKDSFESSLLIILRLYTFHRVITILIPFDAAEPNEYRVLCSRLLFFS